MGWLSRPGPRALFKGAPGGGFPVGYGPESVRVFFKKKQRAEKQIKEILNGLQKSRNKFSPASKIKPHRMNIYLGPKYNFEKHAFFLNSNKIANKTKIKSYLIFLLNPQYFFIFGKVILFPLSYFCNRNY